MSDAEEINQLHTEVAKATETILQKAIRIGELLAKRRKKLAHGQWMPWIKENLIFTDRHARRYLRLYKNRAKLDMRSDLALAEALAQTDDYMSIEAKSVRNRARLAYIAKNATQPVIEALNEGKVSISTAEMIAHSAPETQPQMLLRQPKSRQQPQDKKTIAFPGAEDTMIHRQIMSDLKANDKLELKAGKIYTPFQKAFGRAWRKLIKEHIKQEPDYMVLWQQAFEMVARISTEYPDVQQEDVKRFCQEYGIPYPN